MAPAEWHRNCVTKQTKWNFNPILFVAFGTSIFYTLIFGKLLFHIDHQFPHLVWSPTKQFTSFGNQRFLMITCLKLKLLFIQWGLRFQLIKGILQVQEELRWYLAKNANRKKNTQNMRRLFFFVLAYEQTLWDALVAGGQKRERRACSQAICVLTLG